MEHKKLSIRWRRISDGGWIVDSGASAHMSANLNLLSFLKPTSSIPPITVGNGNHIPVTHTGQSHLQTATKPLALNDILVAPNLIQNLISVRKLTTDNWVSIEFDPFGFTVKDLATQQVIARCNSSGDLYTFHDDAKPKPAATFLATVNLWHQRLGHPNPATVSTLFSNFSLPSCKVAHESALCESMLGYLFLVPLHPL
jgi:hypothetical protein